MRIVVSDTSCMIDLRKGGILEAMLQLPYSFVMPDTLFENEWLGVSIVEGNIVFASMTDGASASFGAMVNHGKSRSLTIIEEVNDDH